MAIVMMASVLPASSLPFAAQARMVTAPGNEQYPVGDITMDGKVTTADAAAVLQISVGLYMGEYGEENLFDYERELADVNSDGRVTTADAAMLLQYAAELLTEFPDPDAYTKNSFLPTDEQAGETFLNLSDLPANAPETVTDATRAFGYFALTTERNAALPFNVACHVTETNITALLPSGVDLSQMVVDYTYYGDKVLYKGETVTADTVFDFTDKVVLTMVARDGSTQTVTVNIETLNTGLPSMAVTQLTYAGAEAIDRDEYSQATFYLGGGDKSVCSYAPDETLLVTGKVKGRGNSSWGLDDKKSYTVKLDKKATLLDMSKSKNWAIVANYEDKSLLRNTMAAYFAEAAAVPYVMQVRPVDMWIDGVYWGTYNLTEKIEIEKDRVSITDTEKPDDAEFTDPKADEVGYLIEFDAHVVEQNAGLPTAWGFNPEDFWQEKGAPYWKALGWSRWEYKYPNPRNSQEQLTGIVYYNPETDETFFQVPNCNGKWATIKKPSTANLEHNPEMREYIFRKVMELDGAIVRVDSDNTWQNLLDVDSFARWALVEELMDNTDASFHSSVYISLDANGKFTFGPAWDFDRSSGNCSYWAHNIGSLIDGTDWGRRVFRTEAGRAALKKAWADFTANTKDWQGELKAEYTMLRESGKLNFARWDIMGKEVYPNPQPITDIKDHEGQMEFLMNWLANRYQQLNAFVAGK